MVTIPLQALLVLNQLITSFSREELPRGWFRFVHVSTDILLVSLVVFHVLLNWDWIQRQYYSKQARTPNRE